MVREFRSSPLDAAERRALLEEALRLQREAPRCARMGIGCKASIAASALIAFGPALLAFADVELTPTTRVGAAVVATFVLMCVVFQRAFAGSGRFAHDAQRAEEALEWLAQRAPAAEPPERRRETVALLLHAHSTDGPMTVPTFDVERARARLGDTLLYVMLVERALRADLRIRPVFTADAARHSG